MALQIFRQEAVDRLASPDRIDEPLRLVRPANWIFLAVIGTMIVSALVFGFSISVPMKAAAPGIVLQPAGVDEVTAEYAGRVEAVLVAPGARVKAGDAIIRLARNERERELSQAEGSLRDAEEQARASEETYQAGENDLATAERKQIDGIAKRTTELRRQLTQREEAVANLRGLIKERAATREELVAYQSDSDSIRNNLRALEQQRIDLSIGAARRRYERSKQRLADRQLVAERQRERDRLREQTGDERVIRTAVSGKLGSITVAPGDVVTAGGAVATIEQGDAAGRRSPLQAVLFAPLGEGKKIAVGMPVELMPDGTPRAVFGYMRGQVTGVSDLPVSQAAMRRRFRDDRLVQQLSTAGAPIEVRVALQAAATPSGFAWSASSGPERRVSAGTLLNAEVVVERRPLVDIVLPGVRNRIAQASQAPAAR